MHGSAFNEKQFLVVPHTPYSIKCNISFFLISSPKLMRAGTGNKNYFSYGLIKESNLKSVLYSSKN